MTAHSNVDDYIDILGPEDAAPAPGRGVRVPAAARQSRGSQLQLPPFIARPYALIRAIPDFGTYLGIGLMLIGFVLLAICWGKVAGLTAVGLQMPYLVSAGFTGLGLIVTGIAIVSAAARENDASQRRAQLSELAGTLRELRLLLNEPAAKALFIPAETGSETGTPAQTFAGEPAAAPSASELTTELVAVVDAPVSASVKVLPRQPRATTARNPRATPVAKPAKRAGR